VKDFVEVKGYQANEIEIIKDESSVKDYVHGLLYLRFTLIKLEKLV
jgi:hypothetical protein